MLRCLFVLSCLALAPLLALADSESMREKSQQRAEIHALVSASDFAGIEKRAAQELASRSRFSDGLWRVSFVYGDFEQALRAQIHDDKAWDAAARRLRSLASQRPQTWLLYEQLLTARAWQARGPGFAREVPPEAWEVFRRYMTQARDVLDSHKAELAGNPAWYSLRLTVANELGEDAKRATDILDEGVQRHPAYHAIYFAGLRYLSPIWHGSRQQMLDLLGRTTFRQGPAAQEGMYARMLWYSDSSGYGLIHAPQIDAEAMRAASDTLASSYPDQWNTQKLFFMACERADKALALRMLDKVREPALPALWERNLPLFDTCRDWATGKEPMFVMRVHDGDEVKDILIK